MRPSRKDRSLSADVFEATRAAVYGYTDAHNSQLKGVPAVASKMGVPAGTLYNKLNLHDHHKLTVADLVQIVTITGDMRPLVALCHTFAMICFPAPDLSRVSDAALLELVNKIGAEGGEFHSAMNRVLSDGKVSRDDYGLVCSEGLQFMGAIAETVSRFEGMVDD